MADEAICTIFVMIDKPTVLCAEICAKIASLISENSVLTTVLPNSELFEIPNMLLARFLSLCGHVALQYVMYLKLDIFAYLRKQEMQRRRRRSSIPKIFSTPKPGFLSTPKSLSRKKHESYRLVPPTDEETTYEQILDMCSKEVKDDTTLLGMLLPFVKEKCLWSLRHHDKEVQAAAALALAKFMLVSEQVCEENMQLFATITEKSPESYIRANMVIAMGDLCTSYPNIVEPWTSQIYQRLRDPESSVREAAIITLTHLILYDFVRVKSLISEAAKCIADSDAGVSSVAMYLFEELSKKGNVIYNIIPDVISSLSDPKSGFSEESFQIVMKHILQYVEKEKLVEGLVEKLCCRFTDSSTEVQLHELTFCLSILTLNDKCYTKLMEFKNLLKERMSDPVIMKYITNISANAKKNDAKTATELEIFRKELGI
ncbi:Condensin complex subunit 1, partial [Stegodyphus mimosarum]